MKFLYVAIFLSVASFQARAQGVGSAAVFGGASGTVSIGAGGSLSTISETVYIGPGTYNIDGTWQIFCKQVVLDPAAVLTGSGMVSFFNPSAVGGAASASLVDGNFLSGTNSVDVNMEVQNTSGMSLTDLSFPAALTSSGFVNNSSSASLYVGRNLNLAVDSANIILGSAVTGDLRFDSDAAISGFRPARAVITNNSIQSHVVKESFTSAFVFPVGIARGDYTPAQVSNTSANTVSVSVQDYTASAATEATADPGPGGLAGDGMKRTWHIFAATAGISSTVTLQHNSSTNQSGFADGSHFVTQWSASIPNTSGDVTVPFTSSSWQSNTVGAGVAGTLSTGGSVAGSSMRSRVYGSGLATGSAAPESYFSKSSDPLHPLPISITQFTAQAEGCDVHLNWESGVETGVAVFNLMHSTDGTQFTLMSAQQADDRKIYTYTHAGAGSGTHYYKIQVQHVDGSYEYTGLRVLRVSCTDRPDASLTVYPNPVSSGLTLYGRMESPVAGDAWVSLVNTYGQLIYREAVQVVKGSNSFTLNTHALAAGMYYMYVQGLPGINLAPVKISISN